MALTGSLTWAQAIPNGHDETLQLYLETACFDCHTGSAPEAGLDLESLRFEPLQRENFDRWVLIHDRIRDGEMPPPDDGIPRPVARIGWSSQPLLPKPESLVLPTKPEPLTEVESALRAVAAKLVTADEQRIANAGRAKVRRLNRFEYENTVQAKLDAPWLQVAHLLPEDGIDHLFNKVGERLDVAHVQISGLLAVADHGLRQAVNAAAHPSETRKFYARDEQSMQHYVHYRSTQSAATRAIVPLLGTKPDLDVIRKKKSFSVGDSDPEDRELEAMGVFSGTYGATTKYDFRRIDAPTDGYYRLRFKTYTFMAGPNGASGGPDDGLTGGSKKWWRPDRNVAFVGLRNEPITLYALGSNGDTRWLTTFDSTPKPSVFECLVSLRQGDNIRPDAARLIRTRPGWTGNPNATPEGVPGFAMNWLEVTGPVHETWPPPSYRAVFDEMPFDIANEDQVKVISQKPQADAERLLTRFYRRLIGEDEVAPTTVQPYLSIFNAAIKLDFDFTDSMISAATAMLCSPEFLYLDAQPGPLSDSQFKQRLAYFLWNGPCEGDLIETAAADESPQATRKLVDQLLNDPRVDRFVNALLDYWLDLRDINVNTPDAELYPDYYLDDLLTESSVLETRLFFKELIDRNLPARHLIDADFAFVNERLAMHYGIPASEGVALRRVELTDLPARGGLLTQASILRVTANGTTTSPVVRGAWVMRRIMGVEIPPPPSGVAAVEPDIRGAKTIREQLDKHRAIESCNACHARFDGAGFALENFDVAGGWRDNYRSVGGEHGSPVVGIGKNGHEFTFEWAQPVDCGGSLLTGQSFDNIVGLKQVLATEERQIARNLLHQFIVYATGAPVSFSGRREIEEILDRAEPSDYGVRTLIHEVVQSKMFRNK